LSCRVLVIPEDPTYNGYILRPLVSRLLRECGKANARVQVLTDPKVQGFEHACASMPEICDRYAHYDVLLFLPDADGRDREGLFAQLEAVAGPRLFCCAAEQEVEAWLLAGHTEKLREKFGRSWPEVHADVSVKENVFSRFLKEYGDSNQPGGGREGLMQQTLGNFRGLLDRCRELADLQERLRKALA